MKKDFTGKLGFAVVGIALAVLFSCAGTAEGDQVRSDSSATKEPAVKIDPAELQATWQLESFESEGESVPTVADGDITLVLTDEGTIRGSSGCNNYRSTYGLGDDGSIRFGALATTRMACRSEIMDQETRFQELLDAVSSVRFDDDRMLLLDADGNAILRFAKVDLAPQEEEEYPEEEAEGE
jgi:heat shock protein HslJ